MVKPLERALKKLERLSEDDQLAFASLIEAELEDEARWQKRFQETPRTIMKIAERAKRQYEAGECSDL